MLVLFTFSMVNPQVGVFFHGTATVLNNYRANKLGARPKHRHSLAFCGAH